MGAMAVAPLRVVNDEPSGTQPFAGVCDVGRCRGWSERALEGAGEALDHVLECIFDARPEHTLRRIPGRATFVWPADSEVVVKRYERGSHADAWHDRAWVGVFRSVGRREAENLRELALSGVPVPRVFGWCEERPSWAWWRARRSAVWMERVEHSEALDAALARAPREAAGRWGPILADLLARLHESGWFHRDAYLEHWLVTERGLVLIDVGRARREPEPRRRWFVKDVAAIAFSCPAQVGARAKLRFLASYLDRRLITERSERRAFARDVLAKMRRIATHTPRYIDHTSRA